MGLRTEKGPGYFHPRHGVADVLHPYHINCPIIDTSFRTLAVKALMFKR